MPPIEFDCAGGAAGVYGHRVGWTTHRGITHVADYVNGEWVYVGTVSR